MVDAAYSIYGRAKVLQPVVGLTTEDEASFGDRFRVHPALDYRVSSKLRMTTGATLKVAMANAYPITDSLYNGGGNLFGADQGLRWQMSPDVFTRFSVGYNYITNYDAAYDADGRLTSVTYNDVSFGTGVGYQW
jgi:hypothetical protein